MEEKDWYLKREVKENKWIETALNLSLKIFTYKGVKIKTNHCCLKDAFSFLVLKRKSKTSILLVILISFYHNYAYYSHVAHLEA